MAIRHSQSPVKKKTSPNSSTKSTGRKAEQPPDNGGDERAIVRKNQKPRSARQSHRGA